MCLQPHRHQTSLDGLASEVTSSFQIEIFVTFGFLIETLFMISFEISPRLAVKAAISKLSLAPRV